MSMILIIIINNLILLVMLTCLMNSQGHSNCVNSLQFSPDGKWIVSASDDNTARVCMNSFIFRIHNIVLVLSIFLAYEMKLIAANI